MPILSKRYRASSIPETNTASAAGKASVCEPPILGKTLPKLLDEACALRPNSKAFNHFSRGHWKAYSNQDFRQDARALSQRLLCLGLAKGDRVAFLMRSDVNFALADLACAYAGLISVPITLTETLANIAFILSHSQAKVLFISNLDLLYQVVPQLWDKTDLNTIIVVDVPQNWPQVREQALHCKVTESKEFVCNSHDSLCLPLFSKEVETQRPCPPFPQCIRTLSWDELCQQEAVSQASSPLDPSQASHSIHPHDVATILYTPVDSGTLKGVMLTHENLTANALTAFRGAKIGWGAQQRALSFLPLTHVFARVLFYGHLYYGHSLYFTSPSRVMKQLGVVKPTIFATVPILLEKTYSKLLQLSQSQSPTHYPATPATDGHRWKRHFSRIQQRLLPQGLSSELSWRLLAWGLHLAQRYEPGQKPQGFYRLQLHLADWLVFRRWRSQFGGKVTCLLCGGAPLRPEVARVFAAAGFPLVQGYGLTQTSSVVAYSRGKHMRPDTVGIPAEGAEIMLTSDGEVLVRGPYTMKGYFRDEAATQSAVDAEGWFHTGDRGQFDCDGFLSITGSKKSLFKLATGKYVAPELLEQAVVRSPLIAHAVAVGRGRKFCGLLVFPDVDALHPHLQALGSAKPLAQLLQHSEILQHYQAWIDTVNQQFPKWSTVKRFQIVNASFPVNTSRDAIAQIFAVQIESLYQETAGTGPRHSAQAVVPPPIAKAVEQPLEKSRIVHSSPSFTMPPS